MRMLVLLVFLFFTMGRANAEPSQLCGEWPQTDFTRSTKEFDEIISGGPPKDGIPAKWEPVFIAANSKKGLDAREPVLTYAPENGPVRTYPIRYLMWHEIVNDVAEGLPIAVAQSPLCNSAMVFDARIDGVRHNLGVSGNLRHSDMIMYDRETHSWWQQANSEGVVGQDAGVSLGQLPAWMEDWDSISANHPDGLVMAEPDWRRAYGTNPYVSYDSSKRPFLYQGEDPPHGINPLQRVERVENRAWTFERLRTLGEIREAGLVLSWRAGQASALDYARNFLGA